MIKKLLLIFLASACSFSVVKAQGVYFTDKQENTIQAAPQQRKIIPHVYRTVSLDTSGIKRFLQTAPKEFTRDARNRQLKLSIPLPSGGFAQFSVVETEVMGAGLAAKFQGIKVYGGKGVDDPAATIKIDWTPRGFHAQVLTPGGSWYIDPYANGDLVNYISYYKKDLDPKTFSEEADPLSGYKITDEQRTEVFNGCAGDTLRRYRLVVACTGEYAVAVGAQTIPQALAAIVTSINRVNGVYETEVAIRMVLVDSTVKVVFIDPVTDPFTQNNNGSGLLTENRRVCDSLIGNANYDIGHCFSTGGGGVAGLGVVCNTTNKARGVTGLPNPTGDAYDIDYVAHEMGHQFGGSHTFNSITGSCGGGNRSAGAAAEPGSGSSIMAYAGICGAINNLQPHSDPYFHAVSYNNITNYTINGNGNSCPVKLLTGNTTPSVYAGLDYIIPKSTPFVLSGTASDPDEDPLTYSWDEMDVNGTAGSWNTPAGQAPLFRFFPPTPSPTRYFPKISDVVTNTMTIGEFLPNYARTINMRLVARDNRAGGGGVCWDQTLLTVDGNSGPFIVTYPNRIDSTIVGTYLHVKWNVANTKSAPINCDSVAIDLSLDGGYTFPINILDRTENDGVEDVIVPNNPTMMARIRVRALKNIFYDMSDSNFTIVKTNVPEFVFNDPETVINCNGTNVNVLLLTASLNGFTTPITLSASGNPAGTGVAFNANPITPGSNVNVTLLGTLLPGNYSFTVTGTAGSVTKNMVINFAIGAPTIAPVLTGPANNATGQTFTPTLTWQAVAGVTGYNLLLSTSSTFADTLLSVTNITTTSYKITTPLIQNTLYYWRISPVNTCGAGRTSSPFVFRTGFVSCGDTLRSTNVPVTIPLAITTVTSTLNVASGGVINDVDVVGLTGTHTFVSDLTFNLKSPANTNVLLFGGVCTSLDNFDINLDDEAPAGAITCPPTGGQVKRPTEALSKFDNENSTGTWTLSISDADPADGGVLTGWGLRICTYTTVNLPVNWLNFSAAKNPDNNSVAVKWQTASEVNNHHYEIERSGDGRNFAEIGHIAAAGNAGVTSTYIFNDLAPLTGISYYRLKQVDKDGTFTYSAIVKVVFSKTPALWSVYPNPASGQTKLYAKTNLNSVQVQLTDVSGKSVYSAYLPVLRSGQSVNIPLYNLAKGVYMIKVMSDLQATSEKLVVE